MDTDLDKIEYVVVVQCHIVKERCSGYLCERAFSGRKGAFSVYRVDRPIRFLPLTCGGCSGRAVHRKLSNLLMQIEKKEKVNKDKIAVHLSSCTAFDSFHGPPCPHKKYLKEIIGGKLGFTLLEGSRISSLTEKRRNEGIYQKKD